MLRTPAKTARILISIYQEKQDPYVMSFDQFRIAGKRDQIKEGFYNPVYTKLNEKGYSIIDLRPASDSVAIIKVDEIINGWKKIGSLTVKKHSNPNLKSK